MKKSDRITLYLEELLANDKERLLSITSKQLKEVSQFHDIGERTIINALKAFKLNQKNLYPKDSHKHLFKRAIVRNYLTKLQAEMTPERFQRISISDLQSVPELKNISKTTIQNSLAAFRKENSIKKYKKPRKSKKLNTSERQILLSTIDSLNRYIKLLEERLKDKSR